MPILDEKIIPVDTVKIPELKIDTLSYSLTPKENPKDLISVEIGDSKDLSQFQPQVKVMRWDNEVNFSARLISSAKTNEVITQEDEKIIWEKGDIKAEYYDLGISDQYPEGAYEFNVVLDTKPSSNVLEFSIETKELDFFYQPELTQEEIEQGASRPENVVGSYAVYHKTKGGMNDSAGKEYKCGKAFHIYRPEVSDSKGNKVWGELNVDVVSKLLTVTIPQKFLDEAVYPVIIDPTFGYTSYGASGSNIAYESGGSRVSSRIGRASTLGVSGTLNKLTARLYGDNPVDVKCFINTENGSGAGSHTQVAVIENSNVAAAENWRDFTASSQSLTATSYILSCCGNPADFSLFSDNVFYVKMDASTGDYYNEEYVDYASPESPWTDTSQNDGYGGQYSIYATYTASGGGNVKKINIGDTWKDISAIKINIGDTWKTVSAMKINIGDSWKSIFSLFLTLSTIIKTFINRL